MTSDWRAVETNAEPATPEKSHFARGFLVS
jgi:hypothetical protein